MENVDELSNLNERFVNYKQGKETELAQKLEEIQELHHIEDTLASELGVQLSEKDNKIKNLEDKLQEQLQELDTLNKGMEGRLQQLTLGNDTKCERINELEKLIEAKQVELLASVNEQESLVKKLHDYEQDITERD